MNLLDFDYAIDNKLIAQTPIDKRDQSRLLVLDKKSGIIEHKQFNNIIDYLDGNDVLVMNDTKVIPARLVGIKKETNAVIEILLLKDLGIGTWECLAKPAKRVKVGTTISFGEGLLRAICIEEKEDGIRIFKLNYTGILYDVLEKLGEMPLPPYIKNKLDEKDRYQTVYAKNYGSAAAPTAGLHFTEELLDMIMAKGVTVVYITLHVGLGTFRPVQEDDISKHVMHSEYYMMSQEAADILNSAKFNGKRIVGVGTTTVRTLETIMNKYNTYVESEGWTDIFIYPPYKFQTINALITNFHLPKSTLLMLVSAFVGRELIMKAYSEAISNQYRFFSFGDGMFIKEDI